jgi:hypothetical protein
MNRLQSSAFDGGWINHMATEEVDPRFADLDAWSLTSAMEAMWEGQLAAIAAIGHALPRRRWAIADELCMSALVPRAVWRSRTAPS